jgi:hypothetical protein
VAVAIAGGGAVVGARWGLVGLIYGVGLGWWARALFGTWLAIPHVRSTPEHPDGGTPGPAAVTAPPSLVAQEIATAAAQEEGH